MFLFHFFSCDLQISPKNIEFGTASCTEFTLKTPSPGNLKGKENPDLPLVCSNYWPPSLALSLCFNPLVLSTFRHCRYAIPQRSAKPKASIHHTVEYPWRNPKFKGTHKNNDSVQILAAKY